MGQWSGTQTPEMSPHTHSQLLLNKRGWRRYSGEQSLQQVLLGSWTTKCKSVRSEPNFTLFTKINSKWLKDLRLLKENIGKASSDINHTNVFLGQSPKAIRTKVNKWNLIKLRSFCPAKGTINKMRR